ncbi:RNA polymerase subunit sigma [Micromonospora ureilytica]|uniref:RNA polymerase sigma-70 factor (ECF subfamily) n=1 Tax=Micromonospora ureilytica TaxID=709868 RepID=A0A3N9XQV7_9ACTN|nr:MULTISPECIES: sigma-70 family RNA polymerase sigma factor [Micromonospora]MBG6064744.1 RNA polymerase sigma-70 factor (ECF subfamily) [Micromonospora ureilytica]MBQ1017080.1 sigma-70 family RNA polymerase sigma factor [Micromonospora sp. D93]RQX15142.1 RNA polymerase subunit sigma [Micromonospora ureilytica]
MSGDPEQARRLRSVPPDTATPPNADELLPRVARGDEAAFATLYDAMAGRVLGLARRVVRDPAQAEEVTQEVMVEVWRTAGRFDAGRGSASAWILTMAHRRAVDRVRSEQAHTNRVLQVAATEQHVPYDEVVEDVTARLEREQVRRCLDRLTPVQRESVTLAYYGGHTYREVAEKLQTPLPTVKTRMRDGLIRMRDCLGIEMGGRA